MLKRKYQKKQCVLIIIVIVYFEYRLLCSIQNPEVIFSCPFYVDACVVVSIFDKFNSKKILATVSLKNYFAFEKYLYNLRKFRFVDAINTQFIF